MNIQIFGTKKDFDSKKTERFFKERGVKAMVIACNTATSAAAAALRAENPDLPICQAVGGIDYLLDTDSKDKDLLALLNHLSPEDRREKILENQRIIRTPIVRNKNQATVGYQPEIWKGWE